MAFKNRKQNYPLYETTHFRDIREMVENVAERFPDRYALSFKKNPHDKEASHYTYQEGKEYVRNLATEFISMGVRDRKVAIVGEASPEWVFSYFALMSTGTVTVPVDKELPAEDIASILNTSECEYIVYSSVVDGKVEKLRELVPTLHTFVYWGQSKLDGAISIEEVRDAGLEKYELGDNSYYDYDIDINKVATIVFTSGTTGKGKGVMLTVGNICSDMEQGMYNFNITERTMCVLPPHHTFGSTVNFVGHYAQGCEIYISSGLRHIMAELKAFKPTHLVLVPLFVETFYKRITSTAEKTGKLGMLKTLIKVSDFLRKIGIDLRKQFFTGSVLSNFGGELEMIICGGAALNQDIIDFFESIGVTILNGYGITECAPLISCNRNEYRKQGSVGLPIIGGKVKIDNPDENGEGEICYNGPNRMVGYYKNEEATREVIDEEGYFHTGDLGKIVTEGEDQWIYITGRRKNLIIFSNGKNVYPEEIETDIQGVYGVSEVVVYAGESKSDPTKEVIVAEIFPDYEALELHNITDPQKYFEDAIKEINKKNVSYKMVGKVKIRKEEFEKNTSKKIQRFKIDKSID
ncbi:MAG: AMP-binding protein [Clostridia bacterium]|nr:AMP-binding protein [Clostridia bacterium]